MGELTSESSMSERDIKCESEVVSNSNEQDWTTGVVGDEVYLSRTVTENLSWIERYKVLESNETLESRETIEVLFSIPKSNNSKELNSLDFTTESPRNWQPRFWSFSCKEFTFSCLILSLPSVNHFHSL